MLREAISTGGNIDPVRCLEITQALTVGFFDRHLKGDGNKSLPSLVNMYPELKQVALK